MYGNKQCGKTSLSVKYQPQGNWKVGRPRNNRKLIGAEVGKQGLLLEEDQTISKDTGECPMLPGVINPATNRQPTYAGHQAIIEPELPTSLLPTLIITVASYQQEGQSPKRLPQGPVS